MTRTLRFSTLAALVFLHSLSGFVWAGEPSRTWRVTSPTREQTFAFGSEQPHRGWIVTGDGTLGVVLGFTNDPYVDRTITREYDSFTFTFPGLRIGPDRRTILFHPTPSRSIPVAEIRAGLFGLRQVHLLPNVFLEVIAPRGRVRASLQIEG